MQIETVTYTVTMLKADEGKAIRHKTDGNLSKEVWLATVDSPDNYEEVDYVPEEEEDEQPAPPPEEEEDKLIS